MDIEQSNATLKRWEDRYRMMTERSQSHGDQIFGGINSWNGLLLRRHRSDLPDIGKLEKQLSEHLDRMQQTETLIVELEDWKNQNTGPQSIDAEQNELSLPIDTRESGLMRQVDKLLMAERDLVSNFVEDAKEFSDNLYTLSDSKQETIRLVKKYRAFIDQHILWIRSAQPLNAQDVKQLWPAVQDTLSFDNWRDAAINLMHDFQRKLWLPVSLHHSLGDTHRKHQQNAANADCPRRAGQSYHHD